VAETDKQGKKFYQGPSPDEISLVDAAREMGFEFDKSTQSTTQITVRGEPKKFELLEVFPFTSDRKRMSVVIRSGGMIKMYTKGADSIVKARLSH
jgi:magnesium-transporting ATPase (P-type)